MNTLLNTLSMVKDHAKLIATQTVAKNNNALVTLYVTYVNGMWVFDDESRGLKAEPFVSGIPEMMEHWLVFDEERNKLDEAFEKGINITVAKREFPGSNAIIRRRHEMGGAWYYDPKSNREGWLCPALLLYFCPQPKSLHIKIDVAG